MAKIAPSKTIVIGDSPNQLLTSFPNDNKKHIDFVLVYEKAREKKTENYEKKELVRKAFFEELNRQGFAIYEIEYEEKKRKVSFVLLNCSNERLLEEAELIRLEMILKNVKIQIIFFPILSLFGPF